MKRLFLLFILLNLIMPQITLAAPPLNYNKEVASDVALRGAIFAVDASNLYAAVCGDNLCISSPVHREGVTLKFKVIALYARMKNYNGLNVGVTHITDDGTITHTIKQLKPDSQGFAYATFDFSTVIISGLTGSTTFSETGLSGNYTKTFNEANVSYIDFNITNHDSASSYIIGGNNYAHRRLLTLNQTAENLTDFQVQKNQTWYTGMQPDMRDNTYTYFENDTELSYWDKSVINNTSKITRLKMPATSTTNTTKIWYYYENSSMGGGSSISGTFVGGDDFTTDGWTDTGSLVYVNTTNEYLYMNGDRSFTDHHSAKAITPLSDFEMEFNISHILSDAAAFSSLVVGIASNDERFLAVDNFIGVFMGYHATSGGVKIQPAKREGDSAVYGTAHYYGYGTTLSVDGVVVIRRSGTTVDVEVWNSDKSSLLTSTQWTGTSLGDLDYFLASNYNDGFDASLSVEWAADDMRMRKYTATEPTWLADGVEQSPSSDFNITTSVIGNTTTINYTTDIPQTHTLIPTANISQIVFNTTSTDWDYTAILYWTNDIILSETATNGEYHANITAIVPLSVDNGTINYTITNTTLMNADFSNYIQLSTNDSNFNESASNLTLPDISLYTTATTGTYYYDLQYDYFFPPTSLAVTDFNYTWINTSWVGDIRADNYSVYRNGAFLENTTDLYYNFTGLSEGTDYTLGVSLWNGSQETGKTALVQSTTNPNGTKITFLDLMDNSDTEFHIYDASGYAVGTVLSNGSDHTLPPGAYVVQVLPANAGYATSPLMLFDLLFAAIQAVVGIVLVLAIALGLGRFMRIIMEARV